MQVDRMLAAVAGLMAWLGLHELYPLSLQHSGQDSASVSLMLGMAIMAGALHFARQIMGH